MHTNCWEYKQCGREPDGVNVAKYGVCPASISSEYQNMNQGRFAGRICWMVAGTLCHKETQGLFARKYRDCHECSFYQVLNYFETIFCNALEGIGVFDDRGVLIDYNERLVEMLDNNIFPGQTKLFEFNHYPFLNLDHTPLDKSDNPFAVNLKKKIPVRNLELILEAGPKQRKYLECSIVPIVAEEMEDPHLLIAFFRDITHKKIVEEMLAYSEKKYRHIFNANLMGVFFFDEKNIIMEANDQMLDLMGYSTQDLKVGLDWTELIISEKAIPLETMMENLMLNGQVGPFELALLRKSKNVLPISFSAAYFPEQKLSLAIVNDLSEQQRLEDMRKNFITTVSHELRTPMTSLLCYLKVLTNAHSHGQEEQRFLEIAERNAKRLANLINTILEVERLEMGSVPRHEEKVDLGQICRLAIEAIAIQAKMKNIVIKENLGAPHVFLARGIPMDLERTVTNLLSNSIKYTLKGYVKVTLAWGPDKQDILIKVEDTGVGIKAEEISKVFEGFYRAKHEITHMVPGTGLGLRIVKDIIEQHGGKIMVESQLGLGTTITLSIPAFNTEPPGKWPT